MAIEPRRGAPYRGYFSGREYPEPRAGTPADYLTAVRTPTEQELLDAVLAMFGSYAPVHGALGPRGCAYLLLGQTIGGRLVVKQTPEGVRPSEVWTFKHVQQAVEALRYTGHLPWDWVSDGRSEWAEPLVTGNLAEALLSVAPRFGPDFWEGQPRRPLLLVEAAGSLGFWSRLGASVGIAAVASSGAAGAQLLRDIAQRGLEQPLFVVVVTDHDPAGWEIADSYHRRAMGHLPVGSDALSWHRLGVTADIAADAGLPLGSEVEGFGPTVQAEQWTAVAPAHARASLMSLLTSELDLSHFADYRAAHAAQVEAVEAALGAVA